MSLFDDIGGSAAIGAALDAFYARVGDDPVVSPYFEDVNMAGLKAHVGSFFAMALGGPSDYHGRDLRTAHVRPRAMGLDESTMEVFLGHFRAVLEYSGFRWTAWMPSWPSPMVPEARCSVPPNCRGLYPVNPICLSGGEGSRNPLGWLGMTQTEEGPSGVKLAELLGVLSFGADLGMGQPMEHVLRQCLIALDFAEPLASAP